MRYGWNLSHGNGLVWNLGERVEGFSNLLMTLIMAAATFLFDRGNAVVAIQLFGGVALLSTGYLSMKIGEALMRKGGFEKSALGSSIFFASGLCYYPLCYWSLMGMETGLLSVLLLAATWAAIESDGRSRVIPMLPVLLGLAFWTRPDAAIPILLIFGYRILGLARARGSARIALAEAGIAGLFFLSISIFRWAYYGELLPNTYRLRLTGLSLWERIDSGAGFVALFLETAWLPLCLAAISAAIQRTRATGLLLLLVLSSIAYQLYVGGDPWLYWRMIAPFMPLAFVLIVVGLASGRSWAMRAAMLIAFFASAIEVNRPFLSEITFDRLPYMVEFNHANVSAALALNEVTTKEASVGVLWAGTIPYYTGLRAIDFLGKTDRRIASLPPDRSGKTAWRGMKSVPGHNKYDLKYSIAQLRPTYVQAGRWGRDDLTEFLRREYLGVRHKGVPLMLRKGAAEVKWDKIDAASGDVKFIGPLKVWGSARPGK